LKNLFKRLRVENNLTKIDISKYLDVNRNFITKVENNKGQPSVSQLEKLSSLYGYDIIQNKKDRIIKNADKIKVTTNVLDSISKIKRIVLNLRTMETLDKNDWNKRIRYFTLL